MKQRELRKPIEQDLAQTDLPSNASVYTSVAGTHKRGTFLQRARTPVLWVASPAQRFTWPTRRRPCACQKGHSKEFAEHAAVLLGHLVARTV